MVSPYWPYNMVGQPALTDHTTMSLSVGLFLSVFVFHHLPVCWSVFLCSCLSPSACAFIFLCVCLSPSGIYLSVSQSHSVFLSFMVSVCMSVCSVFNFVPCCTGWNCGSSQYWLHQWWQVPGVWLQQDAALLWHQPPWSGLCRHFNCL